jgi:hypothetical protein
LYNGVRPHSALANRTPEEFRAQHIAVTVMRQTVDDIVDVLRPEPWPNKFAALYVLMCDKLEEREGSDPSHLLQEWAGIVTCVLEQLPPDSSVVECLALMGVSFNNQWRAQAITLDGSRSQCLRPAQCDPS